MSYKWLLMSYPLVISSNNLNIAHIWKEEIFSAVQHLTICKESIPFLCCGSLTKRPFEKPIFLAKPKISVGSLTHNKKNIPK